MNKIPTAALIVLALVGCHDKKQPVQITCPPGTYLNQMFQCAPIPQPPAPAPVPAPPIPQPPPAPPPVVQPSGAWNLEYSPGMPATFDGSFDFPNRDGVHYITRTEGPKSAGQTVTLRFRLEGDGHLSALKSGQPEPTQAQVHLYLQQGDGLSNAEDTRWWSATGIMLVSPGEYTLTAPLSGEAWSNIWGHNGAGRQGFEAALAGLTKVGFTFGGEGYGHGVFVDQGAVKFTLLDFTIQ